MNMEMFKEKGHDTLDLSLKTRCRVMPGKPTRCYALTLHLGVREEGHTHTRTHKDGGDNVVVANTVPIRITIVKSIPLHGETSREQSWSPILRRLPGKAP